MPRSLNLISFDDRVTDQRRGRRDAFLIGRHPNAGLTIDTSATEVSKIHAFVWLSGSEWWITDLSRNGTIVDGKMVDSVCIHSSATVRLGPDGPAFALIPESWTRGDFLRYPLKHVLG